MALTPARASQVALLPGLSLIIATTAQAVIYSGTYDPFSNGTTPAFNGFASFNIDPACATPGFHYTNQAVIGSGLHCGNATVTSATVFLYGHNPGNPSLAPALAVDTLGLNPADAADQVVIAVLFGAGGALLGVDTPEMLLTASTAYPADNPYHLQFWTDQCFDDGRCRTSGFDPATLTNINGDSLPASVVFCQGARPCATLPGLGAIPEPGTLSLALGALASGWLSRRRKKAQETATPS